MSKFTLHGTVSQ